MKLSNLVATALIFMSISIAWLLLGVNTGRRTDNKYYDLKKEVVNLYGERMKLNAPSLYTKNIVKQQVLVNNQKIIEEVEEKNFIELSKSDVFIDITLDSRKKGNFWYPTFKYEFKGTYTFTVDDPNKTYYLYSAFGSNQSIYSNILFLINDAQHTDILPLVQKQAVEVVPNKNNTVTMYLSFQSTGIDELRYYLTTDERDLTQINDFSLTIKTDFKNYDFPSTMMSPSEKVETDEGALLTWKLNKAVTGKGIGIIIPEKLKPGEIVTKVTFFAPISLLFFFFVLLMMSIIMEVNLHPLHYFFLGAAFFSFHLMYSYFSDHINIYLAFIISSLVSLLLTTSYLRLMVPKKLAYMYAPLSQLLYLIVFSYSFFFDGISGLIVTISSVVTLFVLMQLTGKLNWEEIFNKKHFVKKN